MKLIKKADLCAETVLATISDFIYAISKLSDVLAGVMLLDACISFLSQQSRQLCVLLFSLNFYDLNSVFPFGEVQIFSQSLC